MILKIAAYFVSYVLLVLLLVALNEKRVTLACNSLIFKWAQLGLNQ